MNNVNLVGRLAKDVTLRFTKSGKPVATFDLAVKRRFAREMHRLADKDRELRQESAIRENLVRAEDGRRHDGCARHGRNQADAGLERF